MNYLYFNKASNKKLFMKKENIGHLLRLFRKERKKTLKDVAQSIEVSSSYISQIEKGVRQPSDQSLYNILIKAFELDSSEAEDLIRQWRIKIYSGESLESDISSEESKKVDISKQVLPLYKHVDHSFDHAQPHEYWPFYLENEELRHRLFIWKMNDDSMEPKIPFHAHLIIDRDISNLTYNTVVLVLIDNRPTVRFYQKLDESLKLIAANSAYPVFRGEHVKILGRIIKMLVKI